MHQPHRFETLHSPHEKVEKQQVEIAGFELRQSVAAIAGRDDAVPGAFEQQADGQLYGAVVVDYQDLCQLSLLPALNHVIGRLQVSLNLPSRATSSCRRRSVE